MRYGILALLLFWALPAAAQQAPFPDLIVEEISVGSDVYVYGGAGTSVRRIRCVKCRGSGLPWGGLRPVRKAQLPWGGLPDYCPPAVSRTVVVVTKG